MFVTCLCAFYSNCNAAELYGLLCIDSQLNLQLAKNIDINNMAKEIADAINNSTPGAALEVAALIATHMLCCVRSGLIMYVYVCRYVCIYGTHMTICRHLSPLSKCQAVRP